MNRLAILLILVASAAALFLGYSTPLAPQTITFQAPAITDNGEGLLVNFNLHLRPGKGGIFVNIDNALYKEDSENSLRKAKREAEKFTGLKLDAYDVLVEVEGGRKIVGGESAGAMFASAITSAYSGRKLREDATASAALNEDGSLAPIDGAEEKIRASIAAGKRHFIVAQAQQVRGELLLSQNINIVRVGTAREAIALMLE